MAKAELERFIRDAQINPVLLAAVHQHDSLDHLVEDLQHKGYDLTENDLSDAMDVQTVDETNDRSLGYTFAVSCLTLWKTKGETGADSQQTNPPVF